MYDICTEYTEIIAGTNNHYANAYMEASKHIKATDEKGMKYIENFIKSIERINKKAGNDSRISSSKGVIKAFQGYEDIENAIEFLKKNASNVEGVKDLTTIRNQLHAMQPLYMEGYEKQIRLIILEYETALYMLVTGLSLIIATNVDVNESNKVMIKKKPGSSHGVILKTCKEFAKELSGTHHKEYLDGLIKASKEPPKDTKITESLASGAVVIVNNTIELIDNLFNHAYDIWHHGKNIVNSIKNTLFGIVPLIRCGLYIRYKKKADTIIALEQQMVFIQQNIEKLEKRTNIDPEKKADIIKRQQAYIEAYRKKAEKLRAQLMETEKEAATEISKDDTKMGDTTPDNGPTDDGDFILEGVSIKKHFKKVDMNDRNSQYIKDHMKNHSHSLLKSSKSLDPKDKALADKALAEIKKVTTKDSVRLTLKAKKDKDDDHKGLIKSKFGGTPYWPENMEWPKYGKDDMVLLAQINFAEVPYIKGYPKSGLLQFFCVDDVWYENSSNSKKKYMTIYHEKPDLNVKQISNIPRSTCTGDIPNDPILDFHNDFPFNGVHYIDKFIKENISINICNEREISDIVMPIINKHFNSNYKDLRNMPNELWDYFIDKLNDENHWGHRIGGWPSFTQSDVTTSKYNTLLLQIDSDTTISKNWSDCIMWGDCGVGNIFINDNALSTKDFSDVMFTWDCC